MLPIQQMAKSHPHPLNATAIAQAANCIEACFTCVTICTACANACLAEPHVGDLRTCIRLNLDCADICTATGHIVARQTDYDPDLMHSQLQACITACTVCARECNKHADMHEHCRVCADECRQCAAACELFLESIPV